MRKNGKTKTAAVKSCGMLATLTVIDTITRDELLLDCGIALPYNHHVVR